MSALDLVDPLALALRRAGAAAAARSSRQQATEEEDSTRSSSRDLARSSAQAFCGTCHSCFSPIESWMIESFDDDLDLGGSSPPPLSPAAAAAAAGAAGTRSSTGGRGDGRHFDRAVEYSADTSKDGFYDREGDREDAALPTTWAGATAAERDAPSHRPDGSEIRQGDESNVPPPDRERLRLT